MDSAPSLEGGWKGRKLPWKFHLCIMTEPKGARVRGKHYEKRIMASEGRVSVKVKMMKSVRSEVSPRAGHHRQLLMWHQGQPGQMVHLEQLPQNLKKYPDPGCKQGCQCTLGGIVMMNAE